MIIIINTDSEEGSLSSYFPPDIEDMQKADAIYNDLMLDVVNNSYGYLKGIPNKK